MDMSRDRKAARLVRRAHALLNDGGRHWIKGNYTREIKPGVKGYCAVGALNAARDEKGADYEVYERAVQLLTARLLPEYNEQDESYYYPEDLFDSWEDVITGWNDYPGRNWGDVDKAFRETALALKVQ